MEFRQKIHVTTNVLFYIIFNMKFHEEIHEFSCIRIKNNNLKFISFIHEIPGGT